MSGKKQPDQQGGQAADGPHDGPSRQPSPATQRHRQEYQMSQEFGAILEERVGKLQRLDILKEEQEYAWKFLKSAGIIEGTTAAVLAFICLNRVPRYWARRVARRQQHEQQPYVLDKAPKASQQHYKQSQSTSPFETPDPAQVGEQVNRTRNRFLFSVFELLFDSAMSVGVGIATAIIVSDQQEAIKSIADIPLQPGRSSLADKVCPALIDEYRRQWKLESSASRSSENSNNNDKSRDKHLPFDRREILQDPHYPLLQVMLAVTQNCQHRHVMEQRIREERGLPETAKVEIPEQGVMPEAEDPLLNRMLQEEGKDYRDEIYSYQDVANFVKDQEEKGSPSSSK